MQKTVSLTVNGKPATATVEGRTLLVQLLRELQRMLGAGMRQEDPGRTGRGHGLRATRPKLKSGQAVSRRNGASNTRGSGRSGRTASRSRSGSWARTCSWSARSGCG